MNKISPPEHAGRQQCRAAVALTCQWRDGIFERMCLVYDVRRLGCVRVYDAVCISQMF